MKWYLGILLCSFFLYAPVSLAHELLPKSVVDYVAENPDATAQDIRTYFARENPELYEGFDSKDTILEAVTRKEVGSLTIIKDFAVIGFLHILSGLDHILFVLALLLVFVSISHTLKLTAAFTIAHSITLILASAGIIVLSPQLVEPIIALSITYMAISSVFFKRMAFFSDRHTIFIVFGFGLFHGLGFAGLLRDINIPADTFLLSLVSFNIGIELGQLMIITVALPFIYLFRNKPWYVKAVQFGAAIIGFLGLVWFIDRL